MAAGLWLLISVTARLASRRRAAAVLAVLLLALPGLGCSDLLGPRAPRPLSALPRGDLPELGPGHAIAVLPFRNETGQSLRVPPGNLLKDISAIASGNDATTTVADLLELRAAVELARRGFEVLPVDQVRAAVPHAPEDTATAVRVAQEAGLAGPILAGTLRRFTVTETGLVLVRLELVLLEPKSKEVLWSGRAKRPVPVRGALTWQEIVLDAGGPIFADAFGTPP